MYHQDQHQKKILRSVYRAHLCVFMFLVKTVLTYLTTLTDFYNECSVYCGVYAESLNIIQFNLSL